MANSNHHWRLAPSAEVALAERAAARTDEPIPPPVEASDPRREDYGLVQRLVAGDAVAWKLFVQRFQRLVLARVLVAAREVNQPLVQADAEDLCAEVFSQLVTGNFAVLRRFEGRSTLSTWLCVVTRRIVLRKLSIARREPSRPVQPMPPLDSLPGADGNDPLAILIGGEDRALLATGMAQLGERQRQLACLFYIDGRSYREISEQLQIPMNSIGPTLARIHDKLRAAMKPGNEKT